MPRLAGWPAFCLEPGCNFNHRCSKVGSCDQSFRQGEEDSARWRQWDKALPLLGVDLDGRQPPFTLALVAATGVTRVPQLKATQKGLEGTVGLSTPHQASASDGWGLERGS